MQSWAPHLFLLLQLAHEGAANGPWPHNAHRQGQGGQVEAAVDRPQGSHTVLAINQDGDVVLAAPLGNGPAPTKHPNMAPSSADYHTVSM